VFSSCGTTVFLIANFQRKPATCTRCHTIMYPGPTGSPENHRKGVCSDGVNPSMKMVEWPQPPGIFANGTHFNPIAFLKTLRETYEALVVKTWPNNAVPMEQEAFVKLLASRTTVLADTSVLFQLFDLHIDSSTPDSLIVTHNNLRHLRLDCLA
jgi:hypothetical protein